MAVSRSGNVIRMTADNDTVAMTSGYKIAGVRLVSGSDASTAQLKETDTNGKLIVSLKADPTIQGADELGICFRTDIKILHLDLSGTGAEVFIYLE